MINICSYVGRENVQVEAVFAEVGLREGGYVLANERLALVVLVTRRPIVCRIVQRRLPDLGLTRKLYSIVFIFSTCINERFCILILCRYIHTWKRFSPVGGMA